MCKNIYAHLPATLFPEMTVPPYPEDTLPPRTVRSAIYLTQTGCSELLIVKEKEKFFQSNQKNSFGIAALQPLL